MATNNLPGVDSYYLRIPSVAAARNELQKYPQITARIVDILTHVTKQSEYAWWSDDICRTVDNQIVLEIPKVLDGIQTWLKNNYPNFVYDKVTIRPLLPTEDEL